MLKIKSFTYYLLFICGAFTVVDSAMSSVQVIQYRTSTGSTSQYNVPLDHISSIVTDGAYAWAIDSGKSQGGSSVSFFDGNSWHSPEVLHGTYLDCDTFATSVNDNSLMAMFGPYIFMANTSGHYSWQHSDEKISAIAGGRAWGLARSTSAPDQLMLKVSSTIDKPDMSSTVDASANALIASIPINAPHKVTARLDAEGGQDNVYIYYVDTNKGLSSAEHTFLNYITCHVNHSSTQAEVDTRCNMHKADLTTLLPGFSASTSGALNFSGKTLIFSVSDWANKAVNIWTNDNGKTWVHATPYVGNPVVIQSDVSANRICANQKTQDESGLMYTFPPTISCANLSGNSSQADEQDYVLSAADLEQKKDEMFPLTRGISDQGIWLSEVWTNTQQKQNNHLYFIPFSEQALQIELPIVPGQTDRYSPQYRVLAGHNQEADKVVSCSYSGYASTGGEMKEGLRLQIGTYSAGNWYWKSSSISLPFFVGLGVCDLSSERTSHALGGYNTSTVTSAATIWAYPYYFFAQH